MIPVLDNGYIRYLDHMGTDLTSVNAARASFLKESKEMTDKDERLIRFCLNPGDGAEPHSAIFRHNVISVEVYAPLMITRQWWKYMVASQHTDEQNGWNESSRRYVSDQIEFYTPLEWRKAPDNKKQGSGELMSPEDSRELWEELHIYQEKGEDLFNMALGLGAAPEMARLFLPAYGLLIRWRWTCSLWTYLHVLNQRLKHDAQSEFTQYANAMLTLLEEPFPVVAKQYREVMG